jgi:hypothetical protein
MKACRVFLNTVTCHERDNKNSLFLHTSKGFIITLVLFLYTHSIEDFAILPLAFVLWFWWPTVLNTMLRLSLKNGFFDFDS